MQAAAQLSKTCAALIFRMVNSGKALGEGQATADTFQDVHDDDQHELSFEE